MPRPKLLPVKEEKTGRDEMNLAEFALGLASDRNPHGVKTIERKQTIITPDGKRLEQTWTITGSDKHGLPRAGDDDVLIALLKLASDQGLQSRVVQFSRYELMQILEWPTNGRTYKRIEASLDRLAGVRILAKNSFWDNARKSYTSLNFGLIDDYLIADQPAGARQGQLPIPFTHVSFNEKFFESMRVGNMKRLDMKLSTTVCPRPFPSASTGIWINGAIAPASLTSNSTTWPASIWAWIWGCAVTPRRSSSTWTRPTGSCKNAAF